MKRLLNAIQWAWTVYRQPQVFQKSMLEIMKGQMNFLKETSEQNRPMITHLGTIYIDDEGREHDIKILSLWCGVGDETSPIQRCQDLAKENNKLKSRIAELIKTT